MDFLRLPSGPVTLENVTVPACLLGRPGDLITASISLDAGRIAGPQSLALDMRGAMVLPAFIDMHTHLDKGHIWPRTPNPDGSFMGALTAVLGDRGTDWSAADIGARMEFALRCAWAHGTRAIRTHLDSDPTGALTGWDVFAEIRADWADRIALQGASLSSPDIMDADGPFARLADKVAASRGVLGLFTYPMPDLTDRLRTFFRLAADRGLDTDFHADETMDPGVNTLALIAQVAIEVGFKGRMVAGHTCSLSAMPEDEALRTLDLVARAGIDIVSLPMCNLYLQDRQPGRTPRRRGVTLVHEMKARGIRVSFASDNTRDPFYAYGDLDMLEVLREATRIAHLDHSDPDWVQSVLANPATTCGFDAPSLAPGARADLVIFRARSWTELFSRPQSDRIVLRDGQQIDRTLPEYAELDDLMRTA